MADMLSIGERVMLNNQAVTVTRIDQLQHLLVRTIGAGGKLSKVSKPEEVVDEATAKANEDAKTQLDAEEFADTIRDQIREFEKSMGKTALTTQNSKNAPVQFDSFKEFMAKAAQREHVLLEDPIQTGGQDPQPRPCERIHALLCGITKDAGSKWYVLWVKEYALKIKRKEQTGGSTKAAETKGKANPKSKFPAHPHMLAL